MRLALALAGLLFVVALAAAADLQCYVCDDCETNFKTTAKTCGTDSGGGGGGGSGGGGGGTSEGGSGGGGNGGASGPGGGGASGPGGGGASGPGGGGASGPGGGGASGPGGGDSEGGGASGPGGGEASGPSGPGGGDSEGGGASGPGGGEASGPSESDQSNSQDPSSGKSGLNEAARAVRIDKRSIQMNENSATVSRAALLITRASEVRCVTASIEENGKRKVKRGCSLSGANNEERCKALIGATTQEVKDCKVCEENLCNAAPKLAVAMIPIIISLFIHF